MSMIDFFIAMNSAVGLGLLIGVERQWGQHPAGIRTNAFVCGGAAIYVLMARATAHDNGADTARVAAQIVSGMGFFGGGVILRDGLSVRGLTTAATIWCTAAVGSLCGVGRLREAALAATAILASNMLLNPVSRWIDVRAAKRAFIETTYRVKVVCQMSEERRIRHILAQQVAEHNEMILRSIGIHAADHGDHGLIVADIEMRLGDQHILQDIVAKLNEDESTVSTSWERHA